MSKVLVLEYSQFIGWHTYKEGKKVAETEDGKWIKVDGVWYPKNDGYYKVVNIKEEKQSER